MLKLPSKISPPQAQHCLLLEVCNLSIDTVTIGGCFGWLALNEQVYESICPKKILVCLNMWESSILRTGWRLAASPRCVIQRQRSWRKHTRRRRRTAADLGKFWRNRLNEWICWRTGIVDYIVNMEWVVWTNPETGLRESWCKTTWHPGWKPLAGLLRMFADAELLVMSVVGHLLWNFDFIQIGLFLRFRKPVCSLILSGWTLQPLQQKEGPNSLATETLVVCCVDGEHTTQYYKDCSKPL